MPPPIASKATLIAVLACVALTTGPAYAQDPCTVRTGSADVDSIVVTPRAAPPFTVEVRGVAVEARPTASRSRIDVRVRGPIAFDGRVRALPLRPTRPLTLAGGVLTLSPDARLTRPRCAGGALRVRAMPSLGVYVESVSVPADALTIDAPVRRPYPSTRWEAPTVFVPRGPRLVVRAAPRGGAAIAITIEIARLFPLERIGHARGVSHVRVRWSDGSAIEGWVDDAAIEPMVGFGSATPEILTEYGCGTTGGCGGESLYCGPARLHAASTISAAAGQGAWATVERELDVQVRWVRSEAWAAITRMPGISDERGCGQTRHAFVPATAITLP